MPKRLLLADDSITIQKVVELILSEEDFQIASVNDGQEALDKLETFKPTLVLADVEMPKVNGYSLCKQIKSNENTKHIPVILLVGAFEPLNENNFKDCGASDYLIKPFESQEFLNKIHAALAGSVSDAEVTALEEPVRPASKKEDVEELDDVNIFDDTGVFEEGQAASDDTSELQSFSDSDLTTRELKDVLDSLTGGSGHSDDDTEPKALNNDDIDALFAKKASDNTAVDKQPKVMDNDDIDALFAKKASDNTAADKQPKVMDNDDIDALFAKKASDNTAADKQPKVMDNDDIDALFAKKASDNTAADKQPKVMDNDDIDALFANKMADGPSYSDAQKTVVISEDLHIDASGSADEADKGVLDEQTHDYQTSFASEDVLSALPMSPEKAKIEPPRQPYQPVAVAPQNRPPEPSRPANVLLTTADVSYILRNSLEQKITRFVDEGTILSIFKESVNDYINVSFKDVSVGLNDMVSEAINTKISDVIGEINLEAIVNQVISSTIKGILATLPAEIFKMTREVTEKVITAVLQDNIPAIKRDVEKVIWEAVPGVAERLINHEIEQIKSEFM